MLFPLIYDYIDVIIISIILSSVDKNVISIV